MQNSRTIHMHCHKKWHLRPSKCLLKIIKEPNVLKGNFKVQQEAMKMAFQLFIFGMKSHEKRKKVLRTRPWL